MIFREFKISIPNKLKSSWDKFHSPLLALKQAQDAGTPLLTSIPLQLALDCTENVITKSTLELLLLRTTIYRKPRHTDRSTRPVIVQPDLS